jgi:hypothetical protein
LVRLVYANVRRGLIHRDEQAQALVLAAVDARWAPPEGA